MNISFLQVSLGTLALFWLINRGGYHRRLDQDLRLAVRAHQILTYAFVPLGSLATLVLEPSPEGMLQSIVLLLAFVWIPVAVFYFNALITPKPVRVNKVFEIEKISPDPDREVTWKSTNPNKVFEIDSITPDPDWEVIW